MPIFEYVALNAGGKEKRGKIDANNKKAAATALQNQKLYPTSIKTASEGSAQSEKSTGAIKFFQPRISPRLLVEFTRQFGIMINAGVPYNKALEIIIGDTANPRFQNILAGIRSSVIEGGTLASSMKRYPDIFSSMYVSLVRAGEASGYLADTLLRHVRFMEAQMKLRSKIQTAMIYPSILILLAMGIVVFMVQFILPKILPIFAGFGVELPLPTRIVMGMSHLFSEYGAAALIAAGVGLLGARSFLSSLKGKRAKDKFLLKLPFLNKFLLKIYTFRLMQSLSTLMQCGVDLRESLMIVKDATGNLVYKDTIEELGHSVTKKGFLLSQGLKKSNLMSEGVIQMISVGEESGQLDTLMGKVVENLETEVSGGLEKVVAFLEPAIILVMALVIGFIVISVIMPVFEMNQLVR